MRKLRVSVLLRPNQLARRVQSQFTKAMAAVAATINNSARPRRVTTTSENPIPSSANSGPAGKRKAASLGRFLRSASTAAQVEA